MEDYLCRRKKKNLEILPKIRQICDTFLLTSLKLTHFSPFLQYVTVETIHDEPNCIMKFLGFQKTNYSRVENSHANFLNSANHLIGRKT